MQLFLKEDGGESYSETIHNVYAMLTNDFSINDSGYHCVREYFYAINDLVLSCVEKRDGLYVMTKFSPLGMDELWSLTLSVHNDNVYKRLYNMLIELYTNVQ